MFVIITVQMQNTVHDKVLYMVRERSALRGCFTCDRLLREHDISQKSGLGAFARRKRQHIRRFQLGAEATVELSDIRVAGERDRDAMGNPRRNFGSCSAGSLDDECVYVWKRGPITAVLDNVYGEHFGIFNGPRWQPGHGYFALS